LVFIFAVMLNFPRLFEISGFILSVIVLGSDELGLLRTYLEKNILEYEFYRTYFHG
jgi:hypothetical protein